MNPLIFQVIISALSGAQDWPGEKFIAFCHDIKPLIDKVDVSYYQIAPLYDKYIHRLDKIDVVLNYIEK